MSNSEWGQTTVHGGRAAVLDRPAAKPDRKHLAYAAGLDGVRAFAVTAVVIYHISNTALSGGFLGVDVFFVLSGFLITSILLTEFYDRRRIDIKNFYLRRARRLLPALFTMLATVTLLTWLFARDELHQLRGDVVAAVTYCTNWTQIFWGRGYFQQLSRPSLLQHLWSLAVEEQFYLIWPLLLVLCLAARRKWVVLAVPCVLAVVSLVLMASMFHVGQDTGRIYYGTDTHISPMLIGAAMAIVVALRRKAGVARESSRGRLIADGCALVGAVVLIWSVFEITSTSPGLYRGGYLFISLASAAVIYAAGRRGTFTARLLGWEPLVWIGQRSYAIYLWHWPLLMLWRPGIDTHWPTWIVVTLQVAATVIASDLSFRYIERPIRSRGFAAFVRGGHRRHGVSDRRPATVGTVLVGALALVAVMLGTAPSVAGIQVDSSKTPTLHLHTKAPRQSPSKAGHSKHGKPSAAASSSASSSTAPKQPPFKPPIRVGFFGDSQGMTLLLNKPNGLGRYLITSDDTVEGCGMMTGVIHSRVGYTRDLGADCGSWQTQWRANAQRDHPQIAVIEIGAWDVFDITVNGKDLKFGTAAWNAYFTKTLHKGIRLLLHQGAQVAIMGVPCYRPIAAGGLPLLPERGDDSRTRHLNDLLDAAPAMDPQRVFLIHPPAAFCTNPKIATDVNYRWDGTHYYKPGAALVFQVITPQLLAIPQPPPGDTH
jgi:peptidoglycan/LPS O-acetylase OafA/YrhL